MHDSAHIERLRDRFRGTLLGVAVGDALGAPLEGGPMQRPGDLASWVDAPPHALRYTDDTHATLATARSIVESGGLDAEHMARTLAEQHAREPWRGYGSGPPRVFAAVLRGERWQDAARALFGGSGSFGNGGAMRAAPLGLLHHGDPARAAEAARTAAAITHAHPVGQDGAAVQAAAVALVVDRSGDLDAPALVSELRTLASTQCLRDRLGTLQSLRSPDRGSVVQALGNGIEAHRSVITALHAFVRHPGSFAEGVLFALSLGGDTDTIASMTGALAGAFLGARAIPPAWADAVEGRDELIDLADRLLELAVPDVVPDGG